MSFYPQGATIRITGNFTNASDSAIDPATVSFGFRALNDDPTVFVYGTDEEIVKDSTGVYHVDQALPNAGRHVYRWEGASGAVFEKTIVVEKKRVTIP